MKDLKRKCVNLVAFLSIFGAFLSFILLGISTNFSKKAYADDLITQINTVEDFMDFANQTKSNDYSGVEVNLLSDLDFSNESFQNYYISTEFAGIFNGNGYKLSGLEYISSSFSYLGLFYKVSGTIKNLQISASMNFGEEVISGKAGGLVGNLTGSIDNCAIELNVSNVLSSGVTLGGVVGNYGKNAVYTERNEGTVFLENVHDIGELDIVRLNFFSDSSALLGPQIVHKANSKADDSTSHTRDGISKRICVTEHLNNNRADHARNHISEH